MPHPVSRLTASCFSRFGFAGAQAALVGCPPDELRKALQEAVAQAPELPKSSLGGPWAWDAPATRGSYLFDFGNLNGLSGDEYRWEDFNHDGTVDTRDKVVLGNPNPKYAYGINTSFTYKNFDLELDMQGVAGVDIYNADIAYRYGNENFTEDFFTHRWHGPGTSNTYPSVNVGSNANAAPNSFYVESGAYFRVRNAQLGYTFDAKSLTRYGIKKLRIFANAQNALNIFGYKGFNPEVGSADGTVGNRGIDANVYPLYATYNFGVNVTF